MSEETKQLKVYVGWDSREDIAFQVCKQSILDHTFSEVDIIPVKQKRLRKEELYWRDEDQLGSTEFTFTRFLVPYLNDYNGWALFIDCDFVFLDDVQKLFDQADDRYAIMCAQHDYTPKPGFKMDGKEQFIYPRKNWSSMMLINCGHPDNRKLSLELINDAKTTGAYLHRFSWLKDSQIGKLSHEWNWLVGWYKEPDDGNPKALHYTEGGPWFNNYRNCEYNYEWYEAQANFYKGIIKKQERIYDKLNETDNLNLSDSKKKIIRSVLHYIVDPDQKYYGVTKQHIDSLIEEEMGNKVASIDSEGGVGYAKKGHLYDTYLTSFILGSGGYISNWDRESDKTTALVIRGLGGGSRKAIQHCWKTNRTFYAIDTGYLGNDKSKYWHRITKNALQHMGPVVERPGDRLKALGWSFNKFTTGKKILICPPSQKVMELWGQPDPETWVAQVREQLKQYTDRPIEVRLKPTRGERVTNKPIEAALADNVHCLITYNSIAATEAILAGKPAIALGPNAAQVICNTQLRDIENLHIPSKDQVEAFAKHLSYCQFSYAEMQNGTAWRILNEDS